MKKYILTLAISIFGFIAYSNAGSITLTSDGESYNPSSIYIENVDNFLDSYSISISNDGNECGIFIYGGDYSCYYNSDNNTNCSIPLEAGEYSIIDGGAGYCQSVTISSSLISDGGDNSGNNNGIIIQGGIDNFTPVISRMLEIAGEFVPYIVYIFIGYLGVILLWNAVKYILGYLKKKSREEKNERYRKRRTQKSRDEYRNRLIEYAKHGYDVKEEREAHGYGKRHG